MSAASFLPAAATALASTETTLASTASALASSALTPTNPSTPLSTPTSTANSPASAATKRKKPITKAAKSELRLYFAHTKYTLNTGLPRGGYSVALKNTVEKYGLSRDQICLQLKNIKDAMFGL